MSRGKTSSSNDLRQRARPTEKMAVATLVAAMALLPTPQANSALTMPISATRRLAAAGLLSTIFAGLRKPAAAFDNGVEDMELYRTRIKYPGAPSVLGVQGNGKLASCDYAPNCFSTSGDESHMLPLWKPKAGGGDAMRTLVELIKTYPPFQGRVDGGGFSIITANADYLYVQFESLKNGFIDDLEFSLTRDGKGVQVRSSSRIGFLDCGVNAKRLNWISAKLRDMGWTAPAITKDAYPEYYVLMPFSYDDYIRSVLSPSTCANPGLPLECKGKPGVIP